MTFARPHKSLRSQICKRVEVDKGVWIDEPEGLLDLAVEKEEKVKIKGLLKGYAED